MENEKIIKSDTELTSQIKDYKRLSISRRLFSLGLSGILVTGALLESPEHSTLSTSTTKAVSLPTQLKRQKLTPRAFQQPQYVLSDTAMSAWSPDSQHIATFQENIITLYSANTGKRELIYDKHKDEILAMKWSTDGKYLASGGFDHLVHVWDVVSGQTVTIYNKHTAIVRDVVWSPNQQYLASTGYDKTVQVWEAFTGMPVITYSGHAAEIQTLTWSPNSKYIASTDLQNKTMVWHVI